MHEKRVEIRKFPPKIQFFLLIGEKDEKICKSYQKERFCIKRLVREKCDFEPFWR